MSRLISVLKRPGLQHRTMAYVTAGLVLLFGGLAYFTTLAVRQAREQVYHSNITLAQGLARDVVQDFEYMVSDLKVVMENLKTSGDDLQPIADSLYRAIQTHAARQFFRVSSISLLDEQGRLMAISPAKASEATFFDPEEIQSAAIQNKFSILRPQNAYGDGDRFAIVVLRMPAALENGRTLIVVADTTGLGGILPTIPGGEAGYSMEIVEVDGGTVVAASYPERVGEQSPHYDVLMRYVKTGSGGVEIHRITKGIPGDDRVVAVTPLPKGPFYLTLEQPACRCSGKMSGLTVQRLCQCTTSKYSFQLCV